MTRRLLFAALLSLFVSAPIWAQSTISLASSSSFIDFYTGSPQGSLDVVLGWTPGNNYTGDHSLTGVLNDNDTPAGWGTLPGYSLTSYDPISLTASGGGTFTASSSELSDSVFDVSNTSGGTAFTGVLSALSFSQALSGSNVVTLMATVDGSGAYVADILNLVGSITLAPGGNINDVADADTTVDEAGVIVPEPGTLLLFATGLGLMFLAGGFRRRKYMTA